VQDLVQGGVAEPGVEVPDALAPGEGLVGVVAGVGYLAGGVVTAHTGFSPIAGTVLLAPLALTVVFLVGGSLVLWRLADRS